MLVSVIIPAYNASKTIEKTLQSVFDQDYANIEIIVVDDGSTDDTKTILKKYEDKITYIHQQNAGVSAARNKGYQQAKGEFIQYLDADDLLAKGKLAIQVEVLNEQDADVAYGDWVKFTENEFEFKELEKVSREMSRRPEIELFTDLWIPLAALLYRRSITDKIKQWNISLPIIQDARYALDAAIQGAKFIYIPQVLAYYRAHHTGSLSTGNKLNFISDCFENAKQIDKLWRTDYGKDAEKKKAMIQVLSFCISEFSIYNKEKHKEAISCLLDIEPNYIPEKKGSLRTFSKLFGYRFAERIASIKRKLS